MGLGRALEEEPRGQQVDVFCVGDDDIMMIVKMNQDENMNMKTTRCL